MRTLYANKLSTVALNTGVCVGIEDRLSQLRRYSDT